VLFPENFEFGALKWHILVIMACCYKLKRHAIARSTTRSVDVPYITRNRSPQRPAARLINYFSTWYSRTVSVGRRFPVYLLKSTSDTHNARVGLGAFPAVTRSPSDVCCRSK